MTEPLTSVCICVFNGYKSFCPYPNKCDAVLPTTLVGLLIFRQLTVVYAGLQEIKTIFSKTTEQYLNNREMMQLRLVQFQLINRAIISYYNANITVVREARARG